MSHLNERIEVDNKTDLERAIMTEYGQIVINGDLGKSIVAVYDKKFYEGGVTANDKFENVSTEEVLENQAFFFTIIPVLPRFACTRNDMREYKSEACGETVVLTHNRNQL